MEKFDQRVDLYIEGAAEFAKPLLKHLRELVHKASPDITETIKWGFPFWGYKGDVCYMASFQHHCSFGFWKRALLPDPHHLLKKSADKEVMGQLGRLTTLADLPKDSILIDYIQNAILLNERGITIAKKRANRSKSELIIPAYFTQALDKNPQAKTTFDQFSHYHQKEYVEWITEAKTEVTRQKRMNTALEWLSEGKPRNWKYIKK